MIKFNSADEWQNFESRSAKEGEEVEALASAETIIKTGLNETYLAIAHHQSVDTGPTFNVRSKVGSGILVTIHKLRLKVFHQLLENVRHFAFFSPPINSEGLSVLTLMQEKVMKSANVGLVRHGPSDGSDQIRHKREAEFC